MEEKLNIVHNPDRNRFELREGNALASVEYYVHDGSLDILHTIVPPMMENRGVGSALVRAAYEWADAQGLSRVGTCSFANAWLRRHP